jgi:pentatricopeptide repeat protein
VLSLLLPLLLLLLLPPLLQGIAMDTMTYGAIMFAHSRGGDWQACLQLLDNMKATDVRRDWYVSASHWTCSTQLVHIDIYSAANTHAHVIVVTSCDTDIESCTACVLAVVQLG